jgi:hypothetical protein
MRVKLIQAPEGSPNFCFGLYGKDGKCIEFVQYDRDYASLAYRLGWQPCECGATDGTVSCPHKTVDSMLVEAFDYLSARDGQRFNLSE